MPRRVFNLFSLSAQFRYGSVYKFRLEESRGGFVLQANTLPDDNTSGRHQRLLLDKHGKPSLRMTIVKELKLVRQKSAGESQVISINCNT